MRNRINRAAVCSSSNYALSKRVHREYLKEVHASFIGLAVSTPVQHMQETTAKAWHPKTKTIKVFGKKLVISYGDYLQHNLKGLGY